MKKKQFINILKSIIEDRKKKDDFDIDVYVMTKAGYYVSPLFRKILSETDKKMDEILLPIKSHGWYRSKYKELMLFYRFFKFNEDKEYTIISLLHEFRHRYQDKHLSDFSAYERIMFYLEDYIIDHDRDFYYKHHDRMLQEIDANLFALEYVLEYMKDNKELISQEYFNMYANNVVINLSLYDDELIINRFIELMIYNDKVDEDYSTIRSALIDENGKLQNVASIIKNEAHLEDMLIKCFITSRIVLEQKGFELLTDEEREYLLILINNEIERNNERIEFLHDNGIARFYLKDIKKFRKKIEFYERVIDEIKIIDCLKVAK